MSLLSFSIASTIGKIPALLIEVYSAYHVMNGTNEAKWIVTIAGAIGLFYLWKNGEKIKKEPMLLLYFEVFY